MNYPQQPSGQQGYGAPPPQQGGHPQQQMGYGMMYREYEFSQQDNVTISKVALWAKVLAGVQFAGAGVALLNGNVIQVGISIAVGIALLGAGGALTSVATTQGLDIHHMMKAIDKLSTQFSIRIWATIIGFILAIIIIMIIVLFFAAMISALGS